MKCSRAMVSRAMADAKLAPLPWQGLHATVCAMQRPFAFPGARARYTPDRVVDVEHYAIDLRVHFDEKRIEGSCAITVVPILDAAPRLELDAVELDIRRVTLDGHEVPFAHDGKRLVMRFTRPLAAGEHHTLVVEYAATPRRGL